MHDRKALIEEMVERTIEGMSLRDMGRFIADILEEQYDSIGTDEEFLEFVQDNFPDLLEEDA